MIRTVAFGVARSALAVLLVSLSPFAHAVDDGDLPESLRPNYVDPIVGPENSAAYARGRLGLLRTSYGRASLYAAWRLMQLPPGALGRETFQRDGDWVHGAHVARDPALPDEIHEWLEARVAIVPTEPAARPDYFRHGKEMMPGVTPAFEVDTISANCGADAFSFATRTLRDLRADASLSDGDRRAWIAGQDAVFARCSWTPGAGVAPALPGPLPAKSSARLKSLRAYQHAAALFYSDDFEHARQEFDAFAPNADDPMRPWAMLGALRSVARAASQDPAWDAAWRDAYVRRGLRGDALQAAVAADVARHRQKSAAALYEVQKRVKAITGDPTLGPVHKAAMYTARRVYVQLVPESIMMIMMTNLDHVEASPYRGDSLATWNELYRRSAPDRPAEPMLGALRQHAFFDWILTVQACSDSPKAVDATLCDAEHAHAMARWQAGKGNDWLLATLMTARRPTPADMPAALAARTVSRDRPEWASLQFYAAQVLRAQGQATEAREMLAQVDSLSDLGRRDRKLLADAAKISAN